MYSKLLQGDDKETKGNDFFTVNEEWSYTFSVVEGKTQFTTECANSMISIVIHVQKTNEAGDLLEGAKFILEWSEDGETWVPVVLYQDSNGRTIPKDFLYKLDPPPKGVRVEDAPQKMAKAERPKESFDKLFAGIEKERSSKQAVPPARTIMPQRER